MKIPQITSLYKKCKMLIHYFSVYVLNMEKILFKMLSTAVIQMKVLLESLLSSFLISILQLWNENKRRSDFSARWLLSDQMLWESGEIPSWKRLKIQDFWLLCRKKFNWNGNKLRAYTQSTKIKIILRIWSLIWLGKKKHTTEIPLTELIQWSI